MATRTWLGTVSGLYATSGNWVGGIVAVSGDSVVISADTVNNLTTINTGGAINLVDLTDAGGFMLISGGTSSVHVSGVVALSGSEINADAVPFTFSGTGTFAAVALSGGAVLSGVFTLNNCTLTGNTTITGSVTFTGNTTIEAGTYTGAVLNLISVTLGLSCSFAGATAVIVATGTVLNGGIVIGAGGGVTSQNILDIASAVVGKAEFVAVHDRVLLAIPAFAAGAVNGLAKVNATGYTPVQVYGFAEGEAPTDYLPDAASIALAVSQIGYTLTRGTVYDTVVVKAADGTVDATFHCTPPGGPYTATVRV